MNLQSDCDSVISDLILISGEKITHMKFRCLNCGSCRLGYLSYIRCFIPVEEDQSGNYVYLEPEHSGVLCSGLPQGYCCQKCGHLLSLYGVSVVTESDLQEYCHYFSAEKKEF